MSVARFIADQRTLYRVPHTITCLLLGVSLAWFYKWRDRALGPAASSGLFTVMDRRRDTIDRTVKVSRRQEARPAWLATVARRSTRRRLGGQREDGR